MDANKRILLEGKSDLKTLRSLGLGWALVSAALTVFVVLLPPLDLYGGSKQAAAAVHLLLEISSLVMACLVVFMAWNGLSRSSNAAANTLIGGFSFVVGADLLHLLTYEAMPQWIFPVSTSTAIYFWLAGRGIQLITLLLVFFSINLPGSKSLWFFGGVFGTVILALGGATHAQWLPPTYDAATGLTDFKVGAEYLIAFIAGLLAASFFKRFSKNGDQPDLWLALGAFFLALTELSVTVYTSTSDLSLMFGHALKIASCAFIYKAIFIDGIEAPFSRLVKSENDIKYRELEHHRILENIPVGLVRVDGDGVIQYANKEFFGSLTSKESGETGLHLKEVVTRAYAGEVLAAVSQAQKGENVKSRFKIGSTADTRYLQAIVAPVKAEHGQKNGALAIFTDISDREEALKKLEDSSQEIRELKAALDAHAIVAVTDARGVIVRVNDKFCQISQYRRSELIGATHRIINSGYHPQSYFADLWRTISRGEVWSGEICNRAKDGSLYWVQTTIVPFMGEDGVPVQYIAIRADITKRKEAEEQAQRIALHDPLTGLPNRRLMTERLQHALTTAKRERDHGALLLLDMDHFKDVNDTLGHGAGDELLRQVAGRLINNVRQNDTVARLGGDEFVVILERLDKDVVNATTQAVDLAEKIREELSHTYYVNNSSVNTTPSIGVVVLSALGATADELMKHADIALYKAKEEGRNKIVFFDPALQEKITERSLLLKELRQCLQRNELRIYYQPIVDGKVKIRGVECLIRWQHTTRGLVPPNAFIPLAEQSNLIQQIGEWVLRQACQQLVAWREDAVKCSWTVAVNVSAKQFHDDGFVCQVLDALKETGAPAHLLRLELTESMLHKDLRQTVERMRLLQERGVKFSLDDFGTGYSSLSYLKALPLDQLKIDKSFVQDVLTDDNAAAIARTILSLAQNLDMSVVAEGVETEGQMRFLLENGCQKFQGYLFSKPVPVHQLRECLSIEEGSQSGLMHG